MFDQKDLVHLKNLQRLLGKVKAELDMQEVLAAGDVLRWVSSLAVRIENDIKVRELTAKTPQAPISDPTPEPTKKASKKSKE